MTGNSSNSMLMSHSVRHHRSRQTETTVPRKSPTRRSRWYPGMMLNLPRKSQNPLSPMWLSRPVVPHRRRLIVRIERQRNPMTMKHFDHCFPITSCCSPKIVSLPTPMSLSRFALRSTTVIPVPQKHPMMTIRFGYYRRMMRYSLNIASLVHPMSLNRFALRYRRCWPTASFELQMTPTMKSRFDHCYRLMRYYQTST